MEFYIQNKCEETVNKNFAVKTRTQVITTQSRFGLLLHCFTFSVELFCWMREQCFDMCVEGPVQHDPLHV